MSFQPRGCAQRQRHRPMALFLAVLFSGMSALSYGQPKSKTYTVNIEAMQFSPATLEVKVGDAVT
ncbi:MAG: hypothetical protein JWQ21_357 [Herminiimonas sp.]|nr:hypothetical protein [Herminiimonas sp.]